MKKLLAALGLLLLSALPAHAVICASVPYTFVTGTVANPTQVNANFSTVLNCFNTGTAASGANGDITSLAALTSLTDSGPGSFGSLTVSGDYTSTGTGELKVPVGTTGQRTGTPVNGMVRFNTTLGIYEGYNATSATWDTLGSPPGAVMMVAMAACPTGWLANNGGAISRTTYAVLFGAIGTIYGAGDGSTTFNVPADNGYFWRSVNTSGSGIDPSRGLGTTQQDAVGPHTHDAGLASSVTSPNSSTPSPVIGSGLSTGAVNSGHTAGETRPYNIAFKSCIKY